MTKYYKDEEVKDDFVVDKECSCGNNEAIFIVDDEDEEGIYGTSQCTKCGHEEFDAIVDPLLNFLAGIDQSKLERYEKGI